MTISPYDNLPIGNDEKSGEKVSSSETSAADSVGYIEVDLNDIEGAEPKDITAESQADQAIQPFSADMPNDQNLSLTDAPADQDLPLPDEDHHVPVARSEAEHDNKAPVETESPLHIRKINPLPKTDIVKKQEPVSQVLQHDRQDFTKTTTLNTIPQYSTVKLNNRSGIREYIMPFEEALLVPDTMPDMAEILFAEGKVSLSSSSKSSYENGDFLSGDIVLYTVYRPATEPTSPVDVVKSTIAFKTDKCWDNAEGNSFRASVAIKTVASEMLNERKFTGKGELSICFTEISQKDLSIFKGLNNPDFVQLENTLTATDLNFEIEEITEISQEINIKEDQPRPIKILKDTVEIIENHRQLASGKLVINATAICTALYLGEDNGKNKLSNITNKTDFTQFIVMKDGEDVNLMKINFIADHLKISIENQQEFLLQGEVHTLIQGFKNRDFTMVSDAYHKERDIDFNISQQQLSRVSGTVSGEITAREVINLKDNEKKPAALLCGSRQLKEINAHSEHDRTIIDGSMLVKVLALDEDDYPFVISGDIPLRGSLELPTTSDNFTTDVFAAIKDFWFDEINSRQLEVNVSVAIDVWMSDNATFKTIENLCFVEKKETNRRPPIAVYVVNRDDTLWDIAKRYKSDTATLAELNQIDELRPLPEGMKLFVMK